VDVQPWYEASQRLRPPAHLGEREKQAFIDLIASCPLAQFQPCDVPLLTRWCELELQAQTAAAELRTRMVMADNKPSPWLAIHQQATKGQALLALRLRLGPQSRASKAPKTQPAQMSTYERLAMMEDSTEEGDDEPAN
jgi:hypothetical protein